MKPGKRQKPDRWPYGPLTKTCGKSNPETRIYWNEGWPLAAIVTKLIEYLQIEQECTTEMDFSVWNRAQITQQFLEQLLCLIDGPGKVGGDVKHMGKEQE